MYEINVPERTRLLDYKDLNYPRFFGRFEKVGIKKSITGIEVTTLLVDLRDRYGNLVTDHIWITIEQEDMRSIGLFEEGDIVTFRGNINEYIKSDKSVKDEFAPLIKEYGIIDIREVSLFFGEIEDYLYYKYEPPVKREYDENDIVNKEFITYFYTTKKSQDTRKKRGEVVEDEWIEDYCSDEFIEPERLGRGRFFAKFSAISSRKNGGDRIKNFKLEDVYDEYGNYLTEETWMDLEDEVLSVGFIPFGTYITFEADLTIYFDAAVVTEKGASMFDELFRFYNFSDVSRYFGTEKHIPSYTYKKLPKSPFKNEGDIAKLSYEAVVEEEKARIDRLHKNHKGPDDDLMFEVDEMDLESLLL